MLKIFLGHILICGENTAIGIYVKIRMGRVICACEFWGLRLPLDSYGLKSLPEAEHLCC